MAVPPRAFSIGRRWLPVRAIALLAALLLAACAPNPGPDTPVATKGLLDLREVSFESTGALVLSGDWEFHWRQFLSPEDFPADAPAPGAAFVPVPSGWDGLDAAGRPRPAIGFATYRLRILLPETDMPLSLAVPHIYSAYRLYADGHLIQEFGRPGRTPEDELASQNGRDVHLPNLESPRVDLVLQVSNHFHRDGGIVRQITFGPADDVDAIVGNRRARAFLTVGALVMFAVTHGILYLNRRREPVYLYFAVMLAVATVRTLAISGLGTEVWPTVPPTLMARTEYISLFVMLSFGFAFLRTLYPNEIPLWLVRAVALLYGAFTIVVLVTPPVFFTILREPTQAIAVVLACICIVGLGLAIKNRRDGAVMALCGIALSLIAGAHDTLLLAGVINSTFILEFGLLAMVVSFAGILSIKIGRAFEQTERLATELADVNQSLEARVAERTDDLATANLALRELDDLKNRFLGMAAHDLRNPLTAIRGFSQMLVDPKVETARHGQYAESITAASEQMLDLLNGLLNFSAIQSGKIALDRKNVDFMALVRERLEMVRSTAAIKAITIEDDCKGELIAHIDRGRVGQVIDNLISNAIKFSKPGTAVRVTVRPEGDFVELSVQDHGPGIPEADCDALFDPFRTGSVLPTGGERSTGLGLYIVNNVVMAHGGTVDVQSAVGEGSTFRVRLPIAEGQAE